MARHTMRDRGKKLLNALRSPIGRKIITGITGLGLVIFVLEHMLGNLSYFSGGQAYNKYSHFLTSLGLLLYTIEIGLLAFFIFHIVTGLSIFVRRLRARETNYKVYRSTGTPSMQSLSSRSMIVTGIILAVFLVIHLLSFKYGPGIKEGYVVTLDNGEQIRDLSRLLEEKFHNPLYAFGYPLVMILLGVHLRHGIWSAFQSLGAMNPRLTPVVYALGGLLAVLIAVGFLVLPLYIYFSV